MRKVLSVVLVVVMLAAMATVFPTSAAGEVPGLVITEVMVDSTGFSGHGGDGTDGYEYIEIYNAGTEAVNLYEYSLAKGKRMTGAEIGADPADIVFDKVNPIIQKGTNASGNISTSTYENEFRNHFPTNPETAILEPGKTAVIWVVIGDPVATATYMLERPLEISDFIEGTRMNQYGDALDDILVLAVDGYSAGKEADIATVYGPLGSLTSQSKNAWGVNSAANDSTGFNGRFNLHNSQVRSYGIIKTEDIEVNDKNVPTSTMADCISYVVVNYETADAEMNLMYKSNTQWGSTDTGSKADVTHNFVYSDKASAYAIGKNAGNMKFGDWDCIKHATPGLLLPSQAASFAALGAAPKASVVYEQNRVPTLETSFLYTVYQQNFFGMADTEEIVYDKNDVDAYKRDTQEFLDLIGWEMTEYLSNGGTIRYSIKDEQLIVNNLDVDADGNRAITRPGNTDTTYNATDGVVKVYPSLNMEKIARSDYVIEYDITYLDAQESERYAAIIYNFNEKTSYDIFILRVAGRGNMQRRIGGNAYTTYDDSRTDLFTGNNDTAAQLAAGRTSLINKITDGTTLVTVTSSTPDLSPDDENFAATVPLVGRTLSIRVEVNQVTGPEFYVNDILVSKAATILTDENDPESEVVANPYWGAQTNYNEFAIGFFVSSRVKAAIDNIRVAGYINEYTENDILRAYDQTELKEPATGDATIYVVIAMAVSFISLATLVVAKRRRNEN